MPVDTAVLARTSGSTHLTAIGTVSTVHGVSSQREGSISALHAEGSGGVGHESPHGVTGHAVGIVRASLTTFGAGLALFNSSQGEGVVDTLSARASGSVSVGGVGEAEHGITGETVGETFASGTSS